MALQLPNFQRISFGEANPILSGFQSGTNISNSIADLLNKHLQQQKMRELMPFIAPQAQADLTASQQANQWNPQRWQSDIGLQGAQTNRSNSMLPLDIQKQQLANKYYPDLIKSEIALNQMGGRGSLGTGTKEELFFQQLVSKDNPQLGNDPSKIYEAANALREGRDTLSDGTKLNKLSQAAGDSLDRLKKYGTTSSLITAGVTANQAESELPVYKEAIDKGVKPYGTTVFGQSPQQIKDAVNINDHDAQKRLGQYLGAQQLLFDRSALMLKINALPAGVNLANEIKDLAAQTINAKFPTMSAEARQVASDYVADTISKGLKERNRYGVGARNAAGKQAIANEVNNQSTGDIVWIRDKNRKLVRK